MTLPAQLAALLQTYLDTEASHEAGVPAWPIRKQDDGSTLEYPSISVRADERSGNRLRVVIVQIVVHVAPREGDTTQTDAAEAALAAINMRLRDLDSFYAHLAASPLALRTGWQLHHLTMFTPEDVRRDGEAINTYSTALQVMAQVA
jgi:hypothetical protein